jgi:hypothetical protein
VCGVSHSYFGLTVFLGRQYCFIIIIIVVVVVIVVILLLYRMRDAWKLVDVVAHSVPDGEHGCTCQ